MIHYLPKLPYLVLDQNECRNRRKMKRLFRRCKQRKLKILLPDIATYEFSNVRRPNLTWRLSLKYLCLEPSLVVVGRSIGEMMKEEIVTGEPITDIIDKEGTQAFQKLLGDLRDGDNAGLEKTLANVQRIIGNEKRKRNRHTFKKSILTKRRNFWQKYLTKPDFAKLRNAPLNSIVRILANLDLAKIVYQAAKKDSKSKEKACAIASSPGVYCHAVSTLDAVALDWLAYGGLDGAKKEKTTNDFFDMDYVVSASFGSGLITKDKRVKRTYKALTKALERRYSKINKLLERERKKKSENESG